MSISLEHWFAILTALELDGEVLAAIPDLYARPLKAWEAQKLRSGQRQRASSGRPQPPRPNPEWRWGDEQEEPGE